MNTKYKILNTWIAAIVIALGLFLAIRPVFAQIVTNSVQPSQKNIETGVETVDGFQQVFIIINGNKKFLTDKRENSFNPVTDGNYVAWVTQINGAGQIFRYDISSGKILQITSSSTNLNPKISNGKVVWEWWDGDKWQIFLFDGITTRQITKGDVSFNPDIQGNDIIFARQNSRGELRAVKYLIGQSQTEDVGLGFDKIYPYFDDKGQIAFGTERQKETNFSIKSQNIVAKRALGTTAANQPSPVPQVITEDEVKKELTPAVPGEVSASNSAVSSNSAILNQKTSTSSAAFSPLPFASSSAAASPSAK